VDTFNISLTAAHRRGGKDIAYEEKKKINENEEKVHKNNGIKEAIERHLKSKGREGKVDKDKGYKLRAEDTFLLSAILNGKIYNNFELTVAGIYNAADFKDDKHELESYIKTKGKLSEDVKILNAELRHVLNSGNFKQLGNLFGEIKVETKASDEIKLTNEAKFELKSILKNGQNRETKIKLLNKGEYKGVNELRGELNYGLEVKEDNGNTTLKHEPEIKLGTTINVTEKLSLLSDNSNKVTLEHKSDNISNLTTIKNDFKTTNKIKVKMSKGLDLETLAEYKLGVDFKNSNGKEYTHALLTGGTLSIKKEIEEVNVESKIEGRYLFDTKHKPTEKANDLRHQGFVWTFFI
ncbi:hypothetical protein, partial [Streptobacillus notomytis]|uniref:hypothetical protein n=1 Tax=Streptobacillus notomytis TaxID=1712031 RepID=UPI000AEA69AD